MMSLFPKWEQKFRVYLETVKNLKIDKVKSKSEEDIKKAQRESRYLCNKAEKEYNEEDICDIVANSYEIIHNIVKMYFEKSY